MPAIVPRRIQVPTLQPQGLRLPAQLEGLQRLAYNSYWMWHPRVRVLFRRIDATSWLRYRNPVPLLQTLQNWSEVVEDIDLMVEYRTLLDGFDKYMENGAGHWFQREHGTVLDGPIAYFCAEYGLNESIGIYSGGLGVLAGDHLKAASDMAIPFIGVGLFYRHGYFRQTIDADGHQEHAYPDYDPSRLPLLRVADADGGPLRVAVDLPDRQIWCAVWLAQVGRVPLLLLDTDIPDNPEKDRPITHILYVRGREMRLHQEIVLGVGGARALKALGVEPRVWHLNEGHSALMLVERTRELTKAGTPLDEALERVKRNAVFTIHTPVSAGNERFDTNLVRRLVTPMTKDSNLDLERILELGRGTDNDTTQFDMTAFSLRETNGANAVSHLHAETANGTWSDVVRSPILGITNGVHPPSWIGEPFRRLYEQLGGDLDNLDPQENSFWDRINDIPDSLLWDAHKRQKLELAFFCRRRLQSQFARHGEAPSLLESLADALDPDVLTIGFARRFATYKRAALLFSDEERLARLLLNDDRPVQIVFAGKAHPADRPGQRVIQDIFTRSRSPKFSKRVFVMEDYDIRVGRYLVQGVDVWLNNPRRPLEASGTSGMKAAMNGVINCSVLDGWWDEGYVPAANGRVANGWAIGGRETTADEGAQDWADSQDLYKILENEIIPTYYDRDGRGVPHRWIELMKQSMASTIWDFSTSRMLQEYVDKLYVPAADRRLKARRNGRSDDAAPEAAAADLEPVAVGQESGGPQA
jgi:starch phosphorylase